MRVCVFLFGFRKLAFFRHLGLVASSLDSTLSICSSPVLTDPMRCPFAVTSQTRESGFSLDVRHRMTMLASQNDSYVREPPRLVSLRSLTLTICRTLATSVDIVWVCLISPTLSSIVFSFQPLSIRNAFSGTRTSSRNRSVHLVIITHRFALF